MSRKITSLFLAFMYVILCVNIVSFAADLYIDGPVNLYKPMDSSHTSVSYILKDESDSAVDTTLVSWSVNSGDIIILDNGELLLNKNTPNGTYTITAVCDGVAYTKNVTVVSGFYDDFSSKNEGYMTSAARIPTSSSVIGAKGDFVIDFDYKYSTGANAVALYITTKDQMNDYSVPMYMRSNANNYKIRFLNYVNGITREDKDYVVEKKYSEWANIKIYVKCIPATDTDVEHMVYDVYFENELIFENLRPANTTSTPYDGFRTIVIRQSGFHVDNLKIHSGHPVDAKDDKYKHIGVKITGEDNIGTPRKDESVYVYYDIKNTFGYSLADDASWSVSPSDKGVSVSANGTLCINSGAAVGKYMLSSEVDSVVYTKEINLSKIDYNLVVVGENSYKRDHTFKEEKFTFKANDQYGTPVKVKWELSGNTEGVSLNKLGDTECELYISKNANDGIFSLKAVAEPSENMTVSEFTKTFELVSATYAIHGADTVKKPASVIETVTYTLTSEMGNDVTDDLEWSCNSLPLLRGGTILIDSSVGETVDIQVKYNGEIYTKTISISETEGVTGENFNGTLCYNGADSMSLLSDINSMNLEAVIESDILTEERNDVEWSVVGLNGDISENPDDVCIENSRLYVKGTKVGSVTIEGKLRNSLLSTGNTEIKLVEAFTSLNGSNLTIEGNPDDVIIVSHYKPAEGNFFDAVFSVGTTPEEKEISVSSGADSARVNLNLAQTGMHKIHVEKASGETNVYTVMINDDKLFEQSNLSELLADLRLKDYLEIYSDIDKDTLSDVLGVFSEMNSADTEKIAQFSKNKINLFPASVYAVDFLKGNKDNISRFKQELSDNDFDVHWVDVYSKDSKSLSLNNTVYEKAVDLKSVKDIVVLTAIEKCNSTNSKEIKPYLSLLECPEYDNSDTSGRNYIASKVCGKIYGSLNELTEKIKSIVIPGSGGSGGGSSSGGGSKHQSGTVGTLVSPPVQTPDSESSSGNKFYDLSDTHWAYAYINYLSDKNIINGYANGIFAPENNVTRAEFLKILVSAFGVESDVSDVPFKDVNSSDWFAPYIYTAWQKGLVKGDGEYFRPDDYISRQDASVMIYRFVNYNGKDFNLSEVAYEDDHEISDYAKEAVYALSNAGIIGGMPDGSFAPVSDTTRAEAAKMIYFAMEKGGVR